MMGWFRNNRIWAGRLALVALALQLVLAFGHHHALPLSPSVAVAAAQAGALPSGTDLPGQPDDQDHCAICAVIHLAGTLTLPPPVALPVPAPMPVAWIVSPATQHTALATRAFRARAPPSA